ncbi:hypothetical protein JR316_0003155 [Psilocybe cubensis]|uniref:Uncharacterized protein n=1 Tax=Psilocybe cubensis TaxID=181762 RepID=A0ACB8H6R5_PSICU|nr:hypothetical protein JR316_0003155 [Psilocybe cubensis]KAH9483685.1 hypothetical protein JR316_0003155 [Psilocybe cubensis]
MERCRKRKNREKYVSKGGPSRDDSSEVEIVANVTTAPVIVSCIQCDTSCIADPVYNGRLREFVKDEELLAALAMIGVRFDQHLDLILRMKRSTLEAFFVDHVPATKMDVCTKWRLLRLFMNGNVSADIFTSTSGLDELLHISAPASKDETKFINYGYFDFRVSLQYAMQLDDDEDDALFGSLMDALVDKSCNHFCHPEPDAAALEKIIASICSVVPGHFEKYTNYWPIRIYLLWFYSTVPAITPTYTKEEESAIFADMFSKKVLRTLLRKVDLTHSRLVDLLRDSDPSLSQMSTSITPPRALTPTMLPTIEQIPCPKSSDSLPETRRENHLPVRINRACHTIHAYMHHQNMGELIPVLVHLGFKSEEHFTLLRKTMAAPSSSASPRTSPPAFGITFPEVPFEDKVDREVVLNSPMLSRLGDFQKFLLQIAFDIDRDHDATFTRFIHVILWASIQESAKLREMAMKQSTCRNLVEAAVQLPSLPRPSIKFLDSLIDHNQLDLTPSIIFRHTNSTARVRKLAKSLDSSKPHLEQDTDAWEKVVAVMLNLDPALKDYEDNWPIAEYFNSFTRRRWTRTQDNQLSSRRQRLYSRQLASQKSISHPDTSEVEIAEVEAAV